MGGKRAEMSTIIWEIQKDWMRAHLRSIIRVRTKPFREPENIPQMVTDE